MRHEVGEVDKRVMSASEEGGREHKKFTRKERDGEEESGKDGEGDAQRGLKSRNALTLET